MTTPETRDSLSALRRVFAAGTFSSFPVSGAASMLHDADVPEPVFTDAYCVEQNDNRGLFASPEVRSTAAVHVMLWGISQARPVTDPRDRVQICTVVDGAAKRRGAPDVIRLTVHHGRVVSAKSVFMVDQFAQWGLTGNCGLPGYAGDVVIDALQSAGATGVRAWGPEQDDRIKRLNLELLARRDKVRHSDRANRDIPNIDPTSTNPAGTMHLSKGSDRSEPTAQTDGVPNSIVVAYRNAMIDQAAILDAERAVAQAVAFSRRVLSGRHPLIDMSEDGVLTLQWRQRDRGVLLIFTGDSTVGCSMRRPGSPYSADNVTIGVEESLPSDLTLAIDQIEPQNHFT
jgi:hypothetical protein